MATKQVRQISENDLEILLLVHRLVQASRKSMFVLRPSVAAPRLFCHYEGEKFEVLSIQPPVLKISSRVRDQVCDVALHNCYDFAVQNP